MTDSVGKGLDGKGRPKRKSKILTDEEKEEALTKAATFLEDALNYRYVGTVRADEVASERALGWVGGRSW